MTGKTEHPQLPLMTDKTHFADIHWWKKPLYSFWAWFC